MFKKLIYTIKQFSKTARHHYGDSPLSYFKFFYYSGIRLNRFLLFEADLSSPLTELPIEPEFSIKKPSVVELDIIRRGKDLPREFFYDKLLGTSCCYLAYYETELAYIHWVFFKGDYSRFLSLGDGVAELNYNTTLPRFRGKHLSAKMMNYICHDLQRSGLKKVVGVIHELNYPSIKCIEQAGFTRIGTIHAIGPFHKKLQITA
jgi:ribosomal protein S18 acetylase RimI-like enzyme